MRALFGILLQFLQFVGHIRSPAEDVAISCAANKRIAESNVASNEARRLPLVRACLPVQSPVSVSE